MDAFPDTFKNPLESAWPFLTFWNIASTLVLILFIRKSMTLLNTYYVNKLVYQREIRLVLTMREKLFQKFVDSHKVNLSTKRARKILNSDAWELCAMIKKREVTSEELVVTFANQIYSKSDLNHYAHCDFAATLAIAREKDKMTQSVRARDLPPMHGLPMSFKD